MNMHYYLVSPTRIVRADASSFTYSSEERLPTGMIVVIEIGKINAIGVVLQEVRQPDFEVKPISKIVEEYPLPIELVQTAIWISKYYATHQATVWQAILPSGLSKKRRSINQSTSANTVENRTKNVFTDEQKAALQTIESFHSGTVLLHGVTGSGKTLVYIEAAKQTLKEEQSSIILVPEIALTSQLVAEFSAHLPNVIVTHSKQTEAQRYAIWKRVISSNDPVVIIGPRSALFMPAQQLGLVVIDECHEPSFKQEQSPRYSALRVASVLTNQHRGKLILGSATPAVADYYVAKKSNTPIIAMTKPARPDTVRPNVTLVDMTKRNNFTQHQFLSDPLLKSINTALSKNEQVLIFHNRRGTASITLCDNCGWQAGCPRCFIPLTLHADSHKLSCHICGFSTKVPTSCPECKNADIIHKGIGTKRIEDELQRLFPNKKIARFDKDTDLKATVDERYDELKNGEIDIIIGTQVIAKGLDLPHLTVVGVVQADTGLSLPDYSSPERTFQLLAQVVGRVGRSSTPTEVVVQSYQPSHPSITNGLSQNYTEFYQRTISQRQKTNFPPFTYLLKLTCVYKTEAAAIRNAKKLSELLKSNFDNIEVFGPTPAFYERVRDTYRWQIVVKSPRRQELLDVLNFLPSSHWQYELDPVSLL